MKLDHKTRFMESAYAKQWHDATAAEWFQEGLSAGLLQLQSELPASPDLNSAAAKAFRYEGAKRFTEILLNLTEKPAPPTREPVSQNLDWRANPKHHD